MSRLETFVALILAGWLSFSVLYALFNRRLGNLTRRWDVFRWISAYQLFVETPRSFRLSYRDELSNRDKTEWQAISFFPGWRWHHFFWFPAGLIGKILHSFADDIVRFSEAKKHDAALEKLSERFFYQFVLRFVKRSSMNKSAVARQFKIEEIGGFTEAEKAREVFISEFHK